MTTTTTDAAASIRSLLIAIGENPDRDGLADTPIRVARALREMTMGYWEDPADLLGVTFAVNCDELVVVRDIPFTSLCEHHLLPFTGTATIGYLPGERVVGLSKLARLVHLYARRLQIQERLTTDIAEAIDTHLTPQAVGVIIAAEHSCMAARGVRSAGTMLTSSLRGKLRTEGPLRAEFLSLRTAG